MKEKDGVSVKFVAVWVAVALLAGAYEAASIIWLPAIQKILGLGTGEQWAAPLLGSISTFVFLIVALKTFERVAGRLPTMLTTAFIALALLFKVVTAFPIVYLLAVWLAVWVAESSLPKIPIVVPAILLALCSFLDLTVSYKLIVPYAERIVIPQNYYLTTKLMMGERAFSAGIFEGLGVMICLWLVRGFAVKQPEENAAA